LRVEGAGCRVQGRGFGGARCRAARCPSPLQEQLLSRNVMRFRGGLAFKAHRLLYHSTLCSRVIKKKRGCGGARCRAARCPSRLPNARGTRASTCQRERVILVRVHFIIVKIRWTGLAPWELECPFPGSLTSTDLPRHILGGAWCRAA